MKASGGDQSSSEGSGQSRHNFIGKLEKTEKKAIFLNKQKFCSVTDSTMQSLPNQDSKSIMAKKPAFKVKTTKSGISSAKIKSQEGLVKTKLHSIKKREKEVISR